MGVTWTCEHCEHVSMICTSQCSKCNSTKSDSQPLVNELHMQTLFNRDVPEISDLSLNEGLYFPYTKFKDSQFPAGDGSLGISQRRIQFPFYSTRQNWEVNNWASPEVIHWPVLYQQWPITVFNNPEPGDIIQGKLGDCWLIAALSLVAEVPSILFKIMVTKEYNPVGVYHIKLCDRGMWKIITVDDQFPMNKNNYFIFTYAKRRQLFASLIEKAFAKLHGNYSALKSGRCDEGLQALTGEPTEVLFLRSSNNKISNNNDDIWKRILLARHRGYLMTCPASNPKLGDSVFDKRGIESNHAYSIMDVSYVNQSKLVILRNPWGTRNQQSYHSSDLITLQFEEMPYYFSSISICKFNPMWTEVRKGGQFGSFATSLIESVYTLEIQFPMQIEIELFNAGDGMYYDRKHEPDVDLCLIVTRNGQSLGYNHDVDFYVSFSSDRITPGIYQVIALSFSTLHHKVYPMYNIVFHGSKSFVVHNCKLPNINLATIFHSIARSQNKIHLLSNNASILTFNDNGNFGMVVENRYSQSIRVHTDFHGTKNVFSSRGSHLCIDIVPAFSRVLITLFTRQVYKGNVLISYKSKAQKVNLSEAHQPVLTLENEPLHYAHRL